MSSLTWQCQIWHLTMFVIVSSYVHVSPSLNMLHLVLFLAYSEHNPAKHLIPSKLVEFISLKQIMRTNIFIATWFTEMLVVNVVINDHQQRPILGILMSLQLAHLSIQLQTSRLQHVCHQDPSLRMSQDLLPGHRSRSWWQHHEGHLLPDGLEVTSAHMVGKPPTKPHQLQG